MSAGKAPSFTELLRNALPLPDRKSLDLEGFRRAAVLVPVLPAGEGFGLLLTRRTDEVETHKGQISFPGGVKDPGDTDVVYTALRESEEELGIDPAAVSVLGLLDDLATPTGFVITPVVGLLGSLPSLTVNPVEVAEAFVLPVAFFRDPANGHVEQRLFRGENREVWFYGSGERLVWGATAMIIRSLLARLNLV
jgi:8-oxo-dGTP pyrophosphatase MutT (NUDIX family)